MVSRNVNVSIELSCTFRSYPVVGCLYQVLKSQIAGIFEIRPSRQSLTKNNFKVKKLDWHVTTFLGFDFFM